MEQKHYVVICDWSNEDGKDIEIKGVAHSNDEAKEIFKQFVEAERNFAKENGFEIITDTDECFDAGEDGWYDDNHTCLYIKEVEN